MLLQERFAHLLMFLSLRPVDRLLAQNLDLVKDLQPR